MNELGLFPLPLVLLPSELLPLHVFEERYEELIGECLESGAEFGLVYADDEALAEIGTRARVTEVLTRFPDGRLNILVEGGERFRLLELTSGRTFRTGRVEALVDGGDRADAPVVEEALRLFGQLRDVTGSEVAAPDPGDLLSFALAGKVELPASDKLALLSETSERARMERVRDLLDDALRTAQQVRRAAERAAGNGRVELG